MEWWQLAQAGMRGAKLLKDALRDSSRAPAEKNVMESATDRPTVWGIPTEGHMRTQLQRERRG